MSNKQKLIGMDELFGVIPQKPDEASLRISMREVCDEEDAGSIGCHYVVRSAVEAGWDIAIGPGGECDVELLSVHHCSNYPEVARLSKKGKVRIIGGHAVGVNPRPVIPFADVVMVGEAETWIRKALYLLSKDLRPEALKNLPGTIICSDWEYGQALPTPGLEWPLPKNPAYLNKAAKGHYPTWYLEMARGCPFHCHYCELGHTTRYRVQDTDYLIDQVREADTSQSNRISLFAPDEASHKGYGDVLREIHRKGMVTSFGSMRIEQIIRRKLPLKPNMLVRVGMDGLTEETRHMVHRKQSDDYFVEYFRYMSDMGHTNFKIFMIVGYPWEQPSDLDQWIALMSRIGRVPRKTNAHVRIKVTPLIPQPKTPLEGAEAKYDFAMIKRMEQFISAWRPKRTPGWFFEQDGTVMNFRNWREQCRLAAGDERLLLGIGT